jgi:hypothetical protein
MVDESLQVMGLEAEAGLQAFDVLSLLLDSAPLTPYVLDLTSWSDFQSDATNTTFYQQTYTFISRKLDI